MSETERLVYIKEIEGKWWQVTVEYIGEVGNVVGLLVSDEKPEIDEKRIVYSQQ